MSVNEQDVVQQYLAESSIGRYSPDKIKNVNGGIRKYGLAVHAFGIIALGGMAINSYFHGDYGMAGVATIGELIFIPATYLFERATRPE